MTIWFPRREDGGGVTKPHDMIPLSQLKPRSEKKVSVSLM